jgi:hypothetical protein
MIEISNYDLRFAEIFDQTVTKLNSRLVVVNLSVTQILVQLKIGQLKYSDRKENNDKKGLVLGVIIGLLKFSIKQ